MSLRTSLKSLIRRDPSSSLRERAASLRASVSACTAGPSTLPAPGSVEAKAAFAAACREHSIRTNPPGGWPNLAREGDQIWTRHDLGKAMDTGEITPVEYARLYPLASERELLIETVGHDLNLGSLFALAYADEYPLTLPKFEPELEDRAARPAPISTSLVDQIDFASASLEELQALHDLADRVGTFAYALAWTSRCKTRSGEFNAAGELMQWLGDALTGVESAANEEAKRRRPATPSDRETRLEMLALPIIQNGDPDETAAFARELAAHAEAERAGR